jgi:hypothetical protein
LKDEVKDVKEVEEVKEKEKQRTRRKGTSKKPKGNGDELDR